MTPEEMSLRGRAGAHAVHGKYDSRELTARARAAQFQSYLDQADPERKLPEGERLRRAEHLRRSHMASLALRSARVRRARKAADA